MFGNWLANSDLLGKVLTLVTGVVSLLKSLWPFPKRTPTQPAAAQAPVSREVAVNGGLQLTAQAEKVAVLFGDDLSWAVDYEALIQLQQAKGITHYVVCSMSYLKSPIARRNAKILRQAGATIVPLQEDCGLRGVLIDPGTPQAIFRQVEARLKKGAIPVEPGFPSNDTREYEVFLYRADTDEARMKVVTALYRLLTTYHPRQSGASQIYEPEDSSS